MEKHRRQDGFTAIEMMVVVSILAILTALALPSFTEMVKRYRVKRAAQDLAAMLQLARVEGIKRGGTVRLAKTSASDCGATTTQDWSCGWVLFADANGNGTLETRGDLTLQTSPAPAGVKVTVDPPLDSLLFSRWGNTDGGGTLSIQLKAVNNPTDATTTRICMSPPGRISFVQGADGACASS